MTSFSPSVRKRVPGGSPGLAVSFLIVALGTSGCGTIASLNGPLTDGRPLIMSGTRFNMAALKNRERAEEHFRTAPPRYPMLDLPFSVVFDFIALGFTLPTAAAMEIAGR